MDLGALTQLPCQQKRSASVAAGAATAYLGFDRVLPLPPMVHYAAAGLAVDALCRGGDILNPTAESAYSLGFGIVGAFISGHFLKRGPTM